MLDKPPPSFDSREAPSELSGILDDLFAFLGQFVAYPSDHAQVAHALWVVHTHLMDAWESTPRLAFLSPEPASGKTRALEITELLVPRPVEAVNVTPAYLFRKVASDDGPPTVLFDEIDTVFGPKARDNEEIRGLLNAGHRKGAAAGRCLMQGGRVVTEEIPAYCAVAMAGLGGLPDTILSRSVIIPMRRRAPKEQVQPYRRRVHAAPGHHIRSSLSEWASFYGDLAMSIRPELPSGIQDRDADVWEPLLAIAEMAGGEWVNRARVAGVTLVTQIKEKSPSLGIRLLTDIRSAFGDTQELATKDLLCALHNMEEAPWGDLKGKPLNDRGLASLLNPYGITSTTIRFPEGLRKGYRRKDFVDAWSRYTQLSSY